MIIARKYYVFLQVVITMVHFKNNGWVCVFNMKLCFSLLNVSLLSVSSSCLSIVYVRDFKLRILINLYKVYLSTPVSLTLAHFKVTGV